MNFPRIPIHLQKDTEVNKAFKPRKNPSYESFRDNEIHESQYSKMDGHSTVGAGRYIRRYASGELDVKHLSLMLVELIHKLKFGEALLPVERAILATVYPIKFDRVEAQQAEIRTQLSPSEKKMVKDFLEDHFKQEANWAAGQGGGHVVPDFA